MNNDPYSFHTICYEQVAIFLAWTQRKNKRTEIGTHNFTIFSKNSFDRENIIKRFSCWTVPINQPGSAWSALANAIPLSTKGSLITSGAELPALIALMISFRFTFSFYGSCRHLKKIYQTLWYLELICIEFNNDRPRPVSPPKKNGAPLPIRKTLLHRKIYSNHSKEKAIFFIPQVFLSTITNSTTTFRHQPHTADSDDVNPSDSSISLWRNFLTDTEWSVLFSLSALY